MSDFRGRLAVGAMALLIAAAGVAVVVAARSPITRAGMRPTQSGRGSPTPETVKGRFVFVAAPEQGGGFSIYQMNGDGTGLVDLIDHLSTDRFSISPDGTQVAYSWGDSEAEGSIVIAPLNGGEGRVLTKLDHPQGPAWSPSGEEIAFFTGTGDLYIVGVDGGQPRQVTSSGNTCSDLYPSWSQDASMLGFTRDCEGAGEAGLFTVGSDGTGLNLVSKGNSMHWAAWSPDGSRIAYAKGEGQGDEGIYSVSPDGQAEVLLATGYGSNLTWSPDGSQIAFVRDHAIEVIPAGGGDPYQVPLPAGLLTWRFDWKA